MAGSVVVPDLEMTLMEKSLPSSMATVSITASAERPLPMK